MMLIVGTAFSSIGIALTTTSDLGTTPISSVPYVFSLITGLTFGTTTFIVNTGFFLLEVALMGRKMPKLNILQLPAVLVFGVFIDIAMHLVSGLRPETWAGGLAMSLIGNVWLAAGIFLQVRSKTLVQPGEGLVLALSMRLRRAFGTVKVFFDWTLVAFASATSYLVLAGIDGIREGTLISALIVGLLVKFIARLFPDRNARR